MRHPMRIDLIPVGKDPPNSLNVIIEVPVGAMPSPWEFIHMPRVRGA